MISQIQVYPNQRQLNEANPSDTCTEVPYYELVLSITNVIIPSKIYDERDDFSFEKVRMEMILALPNILFCLI